MTQLRAAAILALVIAGCGVRTIDLDKDLADKDGENGSGDPIPGLTALRITPTSDEATFDGKALDGAPKFRAWGTIRSVESDVTKDVEWTLSRPELGSIAGGRFKSAGVGGRVEVRARAGEVSTTAKLLVRLDVSIPNDIESSVLRAFEQAADSSDSSTLEVVYPPAGAVIPANFANLRTQWHAPAELDRFELRITSEYANLRYYTKSRHDWLDDAATSRYLAPSHPGGAVQIRVSALASRDTKRAVRSSPIALQVAQNALPGAVYYASTTARGLKRSELSATNAFRVVPSGSEPEGATACVSCHAISRAGDRIAASTKDSKLAVYALSDQSEFVPVSWAPPEPMMPPPPAMMPAMPGKPDDKGMMMMPAAMPPMAAMPPKPPPPEYGWGTFNPDGTRLAYAAKGKLHVIDTQTGAETKKVMLPKDVSVTHPDWSPDGRAIAVTYTEMKPAKSEKLVRGSDIALMRVLEDGSLEAPQVVVKSTGPEDTLVYPSFSPDSRYIAFARATGSSKDSAAVQLYIVPADGSATATAIALSRAQAGSPSTMPTWAGASESGPAFLAFSSTRDYGDVLAGTRRDQLWLTAVDLAALERGEDPSAPAVWLPFQDATESNHRALWSTAACAPRPEVCDDRDDDCDGHIDEDCSEVKPEVCGDGEDNDLDGAKDEGCGCSDVDDCNDGIDNDCDMSVDEDCKE